MLTHGLPEPIGQLEAPDSLHLPTYIVPTVIPVEVRGAASPKDASTRAEGLVRACFVGFPFVAHAELCEPLAYPNDRVYDLSPYALPDPEADIPRPTSHRNCEYEDCTLAGHMRLMVQAGEEWYCPTHAPSESEAVAA